MSVRVRAGLSQGTCAGIWHLWLSIGLQLPAISFNLDPLNKLTRSWAQVIIMQIKKESPPVSCASQDNMQKPAGLLTKAILKRVKDLHIPYTCSFVTGPSNF